MTDDQEELVNTLAQLHGDKSETLGPLLERYRSRLEVMIELRLDRRLRNRIDTADVVQETYLEAARRIDRYLEDPQMPFYLWLRFIAGQKVLEMERFHLGAQGRDARREVVAPREPRASSELIARELTGHFTSPTRAAQRDEVRVKVQAMLESMPEADREILVMRHFEQMSNRDVARALGIEPPAASKRYVRALMRIKSVLDELPGLIDTGLRGG